MRKFLKNTWPILSILFITMLLFILNHKSGTYLTGWDNLHPEFNFSINFPRTIFSVWQEDHGLGALTGMTYGADAIRQTLLVLVSFIFPANLLRMLWVMFMLFIGTSGTYFLLKQLFFKEHSQQNQLFSLLGALYYLFNLATLQTFYTPFETFIAHFGFLPWMLFSSLLYIEKPTRNRSVLLCISLFFGSTMALVPTLFIVFLFGITVLIVATFFVVKQKRVFSRAAKLYGIIFLINAFWLLPFLYFTVTSSSVTINSKINQMATDINFLQNKEFGNLTDTILLKGFWFNNVDLSLKEHPQYMMGIWRDHISNPFISIIGYLFFALIIFGVLFAWRKKGEFKLPFLILFAFSIIVLTTNTPPFSFINDLLRQHLPLFHEVFRFPFTKFSTLSSLIYAVFFSLGASYFIIFFKRHVFQRTSEKRLTQLLFGSTVLLFFVYMFPAFSGNLFYNKEQLVIPPQYQKLFAYFQNQDKQTRIANFPQVTFWGWDFYRFGYGGSGFLWYGIKQPILDRAFDVWSNYNENYYNEISNALYAKDAKKLESVFAKYQITFVVIDRNIINPSSPKSLFTSELEELLTKNANTQKSAQFGSISVYKRINQLPHNGFVFQTNMLPKVNGYSWGDNDTAYRDLGNYQSVNTDTNYTYPFRSVFSNKLQSQLTFTARENKNDIVMQTILPNTMPQGGKLAIPSYLKTEKIIPAQLSIEKSSNTTSRILITIKSPSIFLGDKQVYGTTLSGVLYEYENSQIPFTININGVTYYPINHETNKDKFILGTSFLSVAQDNVISISNSKKIIVANQIIPASAIQSLPQLEQTSLLLSANDAKKPLRIVVPKIDDNYQSFVTLPNKAALPQWQVGSCDTFRKGITTSTFTQQDNLSILSLTANNATTCASSYSLGLSHDQGYALFIEHKNENGNSLNFWLLNEDEKYAPINTYLAAGKEFIVSTLVVPPMEPYGKGYSFHFDNISIGQDKTSNDIAKFAMFPIPYTFLTSLRTESTNAPVSSSQIAPISVTHPNDSIYVIKPAENGQVAVVSQAYNSGWHAYIVSQNTFLTRYFPFIFGKKLDSHILVNNWENGWKLSNANQSSYIIITYLPQYLLYVGVLLIFFVPLTIILIHKKYIR